MVTQGNHRDGLPWFWSNLGAGGSRDEVKAAVKAAFKPEFINRLDGVVVFDALSKEQLRGIVDIRVAQLAERLAGTSTARR